MSFPGFILVSGYKSWFFGLKGSVVTLWSVVTIMALMIVSGHNYDTYDCWLSHGDYNQVLLNIGHLLLGFWSAVTYTPNCGRRLSHAATCFQTL